MNQKTALIISAGITTFMLVIGGGAAAIANRVSAEGRTTPTPPVIIDTPATTSNDDRASQREAQYQRLIDQANTQIKQANAEITALKAQLKQGERQTQAQTPTTTPPQVAVDKITSNQALTIALNAVPGAKAIRVPDLVNFQGKPAYEVVLDKGMLYIDAITGAIVDNGATTQPVRTSLGERSHESESDLDD